MDWKEMVSGSKAVLGLIIFFIAIVISVAVYSFIGLFIGGSLETAAINSNLYYVDPTNVSAGLTEVGAGFNTSVNNLVTNIGLVQTPISFFGTLLLVIFVMAIFGGMVMLYGAYKNKKGGAGGDELGY